MIALQSLVSLLLLLGIMVLFNQYRVDRLRQELFEVRDRLFNEASAGKISFNSPAYWMARDMCNGLIRFGHRISLAEFFGFSLIASAKIRKSSTAAFLNDLAQLDPAERQIARQYMDEANLCVIAHLVRSPWIIIMVLPPVAVIVAAKAGIDVLALLLKKSTKSLQSLDALAIKEGERIGIEGQSQAFA